MPIVHLLHLQVLRLSRWDRSLIRYAWYKGIVPLHPIPEVSPCHQTHLVRYRRNLHVQEPLFVSMAMDPKDADLLSTAWLQNDLHILLPY